MVNFLLKVVVCADDLSGSVVETSHHTSLHVGRMMGFEVEIPVGVHGLPVDRYVQAFLFLDFCTTRKVFLRLLQSFFTPCST